MIAFQLSYILTDRDTTHPKVSERISVSQRVDMEQLAWFLSDDDINSRFHQLGFRSLTVHERVYEGWGYNRNTSSNEFGILEKFVANREEGVELLLELGDVLTDVISEETREQIENLLPPQNDVVRPAVWNDRWKREDGASGDQPKTCKCKFSVTLNLGILVISYECEW